MIRRGLHLNAVRSIIAGFMMLGVYGLVVNMVKWDFSRMLGVYVAIFAAVSILTGRFVFKETIPASTWLGLSIIIVGGLVIQFGPHLGK